MDAAFIGLGQMGSGMTDNLVAAGHQVTVWNRDRTKAEPFAARGATVAADLAAAARAGTVMTMLANDAAVRRSRSATAGCSRRVPACSPWA